jgi:hypothetical protein
VAVHLKRALLLEVAIYVCLLRWVLRRPAVPPQGEPVGYAKAVTPVLCLWIFASAAEIPLLHVLLPWHAARVVSVVLGAWGLVWMLGLLASYRVRPHVLDADGLRVRNGPRVDVRLAWADVAEVRVDRRDLPTSVRSIQPTETESGTDLQVGVSGQVNVTIRTRTPVMVRTPAGPLTVAAVSFFVDEPREAAARMREHLERARTASG